MFFYVFLGVAAVFLILLIVIMIMPVRYTGHVFIKEGSVNLKFRISILFFKFDRNLGSFGIEYLGEVFFKNEKPSENMFGKMKPHFKNILDKLCRKNLEVAIQYAAGDPSNTGIVSGFLYVVKAFFRNVDIIVKPDFLCEDVYVKMDICGRIVPVFILGEILKMVVVFIKTGFDARFKGLCRRVRNKNSNKREHRRNRKLNTDEY